MEIVQAVSNLVTNIGFPAAMCILMYKMIDKLIAEMEQSHEKQWEEIARVVESLITIMKEVKEGLHDSRG